MIKLFFSIFLFLNVCVLAQNWKNIGPFKGMDKQGNPLHTMGYVSAIWRNSSQPSEMLLATNSSGIWKTTNNGVNWKNVTDSKAFIPGMGVLSIAANPLQNGEIIAGVSNCTYGDDSYLGKILRSTDNGDTWDFMTSFENPDGNAVIVKVAYLSPKEILVATQKNLLLSEDGGETWEVLFSIDEKLPYIDHVFQEIADFVAFGSKNIILTSSQRFGANGQVWYTNNKGTQWIDLIKERRVETDYEKVFCAKLSEVTNNKAILAITDTKTVSFYEVSQKGEVYTKLGEIKTNYETGDAKAIKFEVEPSILDPNKLYLGFIEFFEWSKEKGLKILSPTANISAEEHDDVRYMEVYLNTNGEEEVLMGNDGGITVYYPKERTFKSLNGDYLSSVQVYKMGISQEEDYKIVIGTQDNGTFEYRREENNWYWLYGGDGGASWVSVDGEKEFHTVNGSLIYSEVGKRDRFYTPNQIQSGWFLDFPVEIDEQEETLFFGSKKSGSAKGATLYVQEVTTNNNKKSFVVDRVGMIGEIAVSTNKKVVYVAAGDYTDKSNKVPMFLKSIDGGNSFKDLTYTKVYTYTDTSTLYDILNYKTITDIVIDPLDEEILYIALSGFYVKYNWSKEYESYRVLRSLDGGNSWEDYSDGLPRNYPTHKLLRHEGSQELMYCGTDDGVYRKERANRNWELIENGFPRNTTVTDLKINYVTNELFAATYGRGIWKMPLASFKKETIQIKKEMDTLVLPQALLKKDIYIKKKKSLTIQEDIILGNGVQIFLEPKSKLIIDGAVLKRGNSKEELPLVVIKEKRFLFFFKRKKGKIILKNNGNIQSNEI